jgi:thiol:disulfide interchange protein
VAGFWLLVAGFWLLVSGCWLLVSVAPDASGGSCVSETLVGRWLICLVFWVGLRRRDARKFAMRHSEIAIVNDVAQGTGSSWDLWHVIPFSEYAGSGGVECRSSIKG